MTKYIIMKHILFRLAVLLLFFVSCQQNKNMREPYTWPTDVQPPVAEKREKIFVAHGDTRVDNYYWLNERDTRPVLDYLTAENAYVDTMMSGTKALQEKLFQEMKGRIKEKDESLPVKMNGYWYYTRFEEGMQYGINCRKKETLEAPEEILFDQNKMAEGKSYFALGQYVISDNNKLAAFAVDEVSRRNYTLRIKNLETGEILSDEIKNVQAGSIVWAADNQHIFYLLRDQVTLLASKVYRHKIGTPSSQDVLVFEEKDNRYYLGLSRSKSKKYIIVESEMNEQNNENYILEATNPTGKFVSFQPREEGVIYYINHKDEQFYVLTNWNAPNFRVMTTPFNNTSKENWKEFIPHRENAYISRIAIFNDYLALGEIQDAMPKVRVINLTSNDDYYIEFDQDVYSANINSNPEFDTDTIRVSYTSLTMPSSIYDVSMKTHEKVLKKQSEVVGGYNIDDYVTERVWVPARDGASVPVTMVYKKGVKKDGQNPLLLYAYGSYGYSMFPSFSSVNLSLLDRGFIYAIAGIRGGQELGRQWYDNGHLLKKMNTFTDFIDCGEYLIKEKYTSKKHLYAMGGSAGGLLMGAVTNLRPDLWNGVVAQVPFVDVITTMSDESIPLTTGEYKEWGNPADSVEYHYIRQYSPYDNVEPKAYPNMLITTGYHDSQVQYFEPAKWVAKLRQNNTGNNIILFKTTMEAGHGGSSGRFNALKEVAEEFAFLLALEGILE